MLLRLTGLFFLSTLLLPTTGFSQNATYHYDMATCIRQILAADDSLGRLRNHACETSSLSVSINEYLKALDALDFGGCPSDFTSAFRKHQGAWYDMLSVTDRYPHLRGEMHLLFKELESSEDADMFAAVLQRIGDSWSEVKLAAASGK